jgi:hypothetical protein
VEYITTGTIAQRVSRWFHLQHDESRVRSCTAPQSASAVAVSKLNAHAGTAAFLAGKSLAAASTEPSSAIVSGPALPKSNRSPEEPEIPRDESDTSFHAVGNIVDVLFEPTQSWRPAVVINKQAISSSVRIKVHFCEFDDTTWDAWLDVSGLDSDRVRELGAGLTTTGEELERKRRDVRFRELMTAQNLRVIEEQRDGNCLFRAFAHQLLGDAERHHEVRARCYEHMLSEKDYFWPFVASDADSISSYINSQRMDGKWGGEPELLALAEAYNKRVRVWLLQNDALSQKTYFESATTLSCVELSYHGGSHYNSLLVLSGKLQELTPLGEGFMVIFSSCWFDDVNFVLLMLNVLLRLIRCVFWSCDEPILVVHRFRPIPLLRPKKLIHWPSSSRDSPCLKLPRLQPIVSTSHPLTPAAVVLTVLLARTTFPNPLVRLSCYLPRSLR